MKRKWLTRGVGCLQAAMVLDTEGDKENAGQQRPRRGGRKRKGQGGAGMSNASTASSFLRRAFFQARVPSTSALTCVSTSDLNIWIVAFRQG